MQERERCCIIFLSYERGPYWFCVQGTNDAMAIATRTSLAEACTTSSKASPESCWMSLLGEYAGFGPLSGDIRILMACYPAVASQLGTQEVHHNSPQCRPQGLSLFAGNCSSLCPSPFRGDRLQWAEKPVQTSSQHTESVLQPCKTGSHQGFQPSQSTLLDWYSQHQKNHHFKSCPHGMQQTPVDSSSNRCILQLRLSFILSTVDCFIDAA